MKRKVLYNDAYGGFSVAEEVVERYCEITGKVDDGFLHYDVVRHDPVLISIVESIGLDKAARGCASLSIQEVEGRYYIDEYDGLETVIEEKDHEWL